MTGSLTTPIVYLTGTNSPFETTNTDATNLTETYITFGSGSSLNDWAHLRQIGGNNQFKLAFDFHDDYEARMVWRKVQSTTSPDVVQIAMELNDTNLSVTGDITAFASDRRLKTNIKPVSNALDIATTLQGYRYTWREDVDGLTMRGNDLGLIAQDLADAGLNECLALAPFDNDDGVSRSGEDYKTIKYNKLHAIWASAFRELKELNDQKDETIRSLEERISRIEALVQANL